MVQLKVKLFRGVLGRELFSILRITKAAIQSGSILDQELLVLP